MVYLDSSLLSISISRATPLKYVSTAVGGLSHNHKDFSAVNAFHQASPDSSAIVTIQRASGLNI